MRLVNARSRDDEKLELKEDRIKRDERKCVRKRKQGTASREIENIITKRQQEISLSQ